MHEIILQLAVGAVAGLGLGWLFFAGLRWTVRRLPRTAHPAALMAGSFIVRTAAVLAGLWGLGAGSVTRLSGALIGLLGARLLAVRAPFRASREPVAGERVS